ncbi:reverse transcriptase domain, Reverse transcriptase zinc-binding domain protein [Artemisia annua]|uniref:Reverse transcriptase domain, Reverse transcriptase zinc-binding domain protein n=1 Tax=Artemisia annua TaxID=35608 RepID=A0A2U1Q3Y9_ARTAN|nr:reverse transcriptase domain, Reverse transcriptase zinc-binding domain protein [Artemisia annua]
MAKLIGCGAANLPLKYLGVPVGCNMSRCSNWNAIIQKFSSKLSQWKAHLLSVGGLLSLINFVLGNLPTYYMSIYMMPMTIQKKLEMMHNNFFIGGDESDKKVTWVRWKKCLASKKLGGLGVGSIFALNVGLLFKWLWRFLCHPTDPWARVIKNIYGLNGGIDEEKIGNGVSTRFWVDTWCGDRPLKLQYPRIYMLDNDRSCNVANRLQAAS